MRTFTISSGALSARISPAGGVILDCFFEDSPLLRPYAADDSGPPDPLKAGNFPMLPFGNRVEENTFEYDGSEYHLSPNTDWDPHYLHGDGWLSPWRAAANTDESLTLRLGHDDDPNAPYIYHAEQIISVGARSLRLRLSVTNRGERAMPFGLGHHLFFPLTPRTTLAARAESFWSEKHDYLPDERLPIPAELNFESPAKLPERWINNGFEGWNGIAEIRWPEHRLAAKIRAAQPFDVYFLFRSDTDFDSSFSGDFFCFEPMTHLANAHRLPASAGRTGLARLEPGQSLSTEVEIEAFRI